MKNRDTVTLDKGKVKVEVENRVAINGEMGKTHWQLPEYFSMKVDFKLKNQEVTKTVKKMTFSLGQKK